MDMDNLLPAGRLAAFDADDLTVISALVQDAVCKVGDMEFAPAKHAFTLVANRFAWEKGHARAKTGERLRSVLHFARVTGVKATGIDQTRKDQVLSLLAVRFAQSDAPAGDVDLIFSGGATLRLSVECLECALSDMPGTWAAIATPRHDV